MLFGFCAKCSTIMLALNPGTNYFLEPEQAVQASAQSIFINAHGNDLTCHACLRICVNVPLVIRLSLIPKLKQKSQF